VPSDDDDDDDDNNNNNNSMQFFNIYVPSQQLQGQLQTHHSVDDDDDSIQFNSILYYLCAE
jgi:hypothetical protein